MAFNAGAVVGRAIMDATAWQAGAATINKTNAKTAKSMALLSKGALIASAAIAAGLIAATAKANEFEKAFSNVTTLVDESVVDVQSMKSELLDLDSRLGSATDLTVGLYQALSASVEPAKAVEFVATSAEFAKAALIDTNTAVDVITTGLNAYGLEAEAAAGVSDKLFSVIKLGKVTGEELAATIGQSIPLAANMGIEFDELGASMAVMTRQGVKASQATTQFNAIVNALLKPSKEMQETLNDLGFATGEAALETLGFKGTLDILVDSTKGSKEEMAKLFNNTRALRGIMALTGEGAQDFDDILKEIENSTGATSDAFEKQELTFETLANSMEKLAIDVGEVLLPFIFDLVDGVTAGVEWFTNLDTGTQELIVTVAALTAVVIPATIAIGKMVSLFGAGPVGIVIGAIGLLAGAVVLLSDSTETLTGNLEDQIKAQEEQLTNIKELTAEYESLAENENKTLEEEKKLLKVENQLKDLLPESTLLLDKQGRIIEINAEELRKFNIQKVKQNIEDKKQLLLLKEQEKIDLLSDLALRGRQLADLADDNEDLTASTIDLITADERYQQDLQSLKFDEEAVAARRQTNVDFVEDLRDATQELIDTIDEEAAVTKLEITALENELTALENDTAATMINNDAKRDNILATTEQGDASNEFVFDLEKEWTAFDRLSVAIRASNDEIINSIEPMQRFKGEIREITEGMETVVLLSGEMFGDAFRETLEQNLLMPFDQLGVALAEGTDLLAALGSGFLDFTKILVSKVAEMLLVAGLQLLIFGGPAMIPVGLGLIAASAVVSVGGGAISATASKVRTRDFLISKAAEGGNKRGLTIVGERGPELINLGTTSRVFPANETRGMMGGINIGSMVTVNGNIDKDVDLERLMIRAGKRVQAELRSI
jgi:TP901 family phage tail tape measure protein